jgi:hypothetical protein
MILLELYSDAEKLLKEILKKIALIEDRSTKIITMVMLICLRYLNKDATNSDNETLIRELLRLLDLKDSRLIDWNFQNLKNIIDNKDIKSEDKEFLKNLLSIPGSKTKNEYELLKKKIQDFVINDEHDFRNVHYIPDDEEKITVKFDKKNLGKSELDEIEWVLWNISLKISTEFINDESVDYVIYTFDPTFQDKRDNKTLYPNDGKGDFSINVIGWEETKFEIELHLKNGSIQKMVSNLKL